MPPKAGLEVLAHRIMSTLLSLIPSVFANFKKSAFIRKEKRKAQMKKAR
jgi:hypothetical protein